MDTGIQCNSKEIRLCVTSKITEKKDILESAKEEKRVAFGFGQSNVWFARGEDDNKLLSDFWIGLKFRLVNTMGKTGLINMQMINENWG